MNRIFLGLALVIFLFGGVGPGLAGSEHGRPILVRVDDALKAFGPDGSALKVLGDYWAPSWSPDGTRFVALVPQAAPNERFSFPAIFDRSGAGRYLFPELPVGTYLYRPIWSPDGRSVALIQYAPSGFAFIIVDAETAEITAEGEIHEKYTADFPYYTAGFDTFAWSPDGKKVVLSWGGVLVFDVLSGEVQVASEGFALAFWAPDSGGVCLLQYEREGPNPFVLNQLSRYELSSGKLRVIGSANDLTNAGIDPAKWLLVGKIRLSPDGTSVALSMGNLTTENDAIRVYDASPDCVKELDKPRQVIETELVPVMEWAPDGGAIAVIEQVHVPGRGFSFEARVIELETGERTKLAGFELQGLEVDVLGLVGFLAWSR